MRHLRALGSLGDDRAVPTLRTWAAPGKELDSRQAAINSLARLEKGNKEITNQIAGYLMEQHFPFALRPYSLSALAAMPRPFRPGSVAEKQRSKHRDGADD